MPQISTEEYERLPLRAHAFLAGVPLHDVWAIDLPRMRSGITLGEFLRAAGGPPFKPSRVVRALLRLRFFVGGLFGWDRERQPPGGGGTFSTRLTSTDCSRPLGPAGHRRGAFPLLVPVR